MFKNEIVIDQADLRPKWYRIGNALTVYDLSLTKLYQLLHAGVLETVVLKKKGGTGGLRLISAASLDKHFANHTSTTWTPMYEGPSNPGRHPKENGTKSKSKKNGSPAAKRKAVAK